MAKLIEKIKDKRAPEPETPARRDIPVVHPAPEQGLTSAQVRERTDAGWTNAPVDPPGKTVKQIVLSNIFTYFNMLFFLLALCVIAVQQWLNLTFMGVIIVNTAIGIVQELRSKKTLDKLSILVTVLFSYVVFHEKLTKKSALGLAGIVAGTLLMLV